MKKFSLLTCIFVVSFLISCGTTQAVRQDTNEEPVKETPVTVQEAPVPVQETPAPIQETLTPVPEASAPVQETPVPVPVTPAPVQKAPEPVPVVPAPAQKAPVPVPETPAPIQKTPAKNDDEYHRSVNDIEITKETFAEDKTEIMNLISRLAAVMAVGDYDSWIKYIDTESVKYWSNPQNLRKASKMLPVKGLFMNNLHDYFTYIFVPSRKGREVDEIRYISANNVKAVEVSENTDIVYYYFTKINGTWLVHIPPL
jgi:hypothetical protein